MRDQLIIILRDARSIQIGADCNRVKEFANNIEVEAMSALQGGKHLIPSNMFGEITIPKGVITKMSIGEDDLWFSHGCALDVNVFYGRGWQWAIYPVNHEGTNTDHLIEKGTL